MNKPRAATASRKTLLICVTVILAAVLAGTWAVRRGRTAAPVPGTAGAAPMSASAILAAVPKPSGNTLTDKAIAKSLEKLNEDARSDKYWVDLGDALMQHVRETTDAAYYPHAERAYNQALLHNPKNADALTGLAWVNGGQHNFPESIRRAKEAIALDPKNNAAYGILGDANVELGEYDAAFKHYQKMLDIRPDLSSYSRGAQLLFLTGDKRKGMWLMAKAIKAGGPFSENTAWCRAQLGLMLWNDGAVLPAQQVLAEGLKASPNNLHLLSAMGKVKTALRDYPAAIALYQKALAITPEHNALVALGDLYAVTGNKTEAEKQYAKVEELHQKSHAASDTSHNFPMAQFYADHDRNLVEAVRLAETRKNTKNVHEADTLAWCYYKTGDMDKAKEAITRALAHNTPDARILFHAGMIEAKRGNRISAKKYLDQALSLNPNFSPVLAPVAAQTLSRLGTRSSVASGSGAAAAAKSDDAAAATRR